MILVFKSPYCLCTHVQVEREKATLSSTVHDLQQQLSQSKDALSEQQVKMEQLTQCLETLQSTASKRPAEQENGMSSSPRSLQNQETENGISYYEVDAKSTEVLECRMQAANEELVCLHEELKEAGERSKALEERYKQEKKCWRGEAQELADKIRQCIAASRRDQERIGQLEREIGATRQVATDSEGHLSAAQEELLAFSEELANLYHHVCVCNNLTPSRVTLNYYREVAQSGRTHNHSQPHHYRGSLRRHRRSGEVLDPGSGGRGDTSSCGSSPGSPTLDFRDPTNVRNLVAIIRCQIKHLQVCLSQGQKHFCHLLGLHG